MIFAITVEYAGIGNILLCYLYINFLHLFIYYLFGQNEIQCIPQSVLVLHHRANSPVVYGYSFIYSFIWYLGRMHAMNTPHPNLPPLRHLKAGFVEFRAKFLVSFSKQCYLSRLDFLKYFEPCF